jgi:hypothetical protein
MPKDDPLGQMHPRRVLWLGKENMAEARDNYYRAYQDYWRQNAPAMFSAHTMPEKHDWDTAWAAAIAAFSYLMEGRTEPR